MRRTTTKFDSRGLAALAFAAAAAIEPAFADDELPALSAKMDEISVSGISSGAYMAGQFHIAHSKIVMGAAIIAGGPYGCAESPYAGFVPGANAWRALSACMNDAMRVWGVPNARILARGAERLAKEGRIDPLENVKSGRVYLFAGKEDRTVKPAIVAAAVEFYANLGLSKESIRFVADYGAGHAFVTEASGGACEVSAKPYIVDCDYDQAGELLRHIHGKLAPPAAAPSAEFALFDQQPFTEGLAAGMGGKGVVYIPAACRSKSGCRIHVAFHGCAQSRDEAGEAFTKETGFARWAETNDFILLFPQAGKGFGNPQGCWDWWGYTGGDYLTRDAPQIRAVHRMIERLAASDGMR